MERKQTTLIQSAAVHAQTQKREAVTGAHISLSITHAKSGSLTRGACCKAASASSNIQRTA